MPAPFVIGVENQLIIRLGGVHRIDIATIQVDIVDLNGNALMSNLSLSGLEAGNNVLRAMFTPPAASFRVRLTGMLMNIFTTHVLLVTTV